MTAKIEALRAPRQLSPWIVIGAAAALIAGLAVLAVQETEVAPTRAPTVEAVGASVAVEMAELKSAVAHRYMVEHFGIGESSPAVNEQALEAAMKASLAHGSLQPRFGAGESSSTEGKAALERANQARLENGWFRKS